MMTKEEFEKEFAKRSGTTIEWLHSMNQVSIPCDCGENGCQGWQMVNKDGILFKDFQQTLKPPVE